MFTGANIVIDGIVGAIDAGSYHKVRPTQVSDDYYMNLLGGASTQRCFINDATTIPSSDPASFGFGADRNTYIQIPIADGTFPTDDGPFDFSSGAGYTVDVWFMRTGYGTWQSGDTNIDGIWNYYWNHYLAFSGAHTGQNYIFGRGLSNYTIQMDTWYNVTMTHDNSDTSQHKVYIDGSLHQTSTQANAASARRFFIGNYDSSWAMVGEIACIRIYNRPLTASEVTQNYNATKTRF